MVWCGTVVHVWCGVLPGVLTCQQELVAMCLALLEAVRWRNPECHAPSLGSKLPWDSSAGRHPVERIIPMSSSIVQQIAGTLDYQVYTAWSLGL